MAKRVRGSSRPGRRRPIDRRPATSATRPATPAASTPAAASATTPAPRPSGLTDAELARAAQLEAQLLADERSADTARRRTQERTAVLREGAGARALRPEEEYAYVGRDLRDIARIAALLLAILFGLWILIDVAGIVTIA